LVKEGSVGAVSRTDCLKTLNPPRVVWILVPAAFVDQTVRQLTELMSPDNRIIDGGDSYYQDNLDHRSLEEAVSVSVLSAALYSQFSSYSEADFADKLLPLMRFGFDGHIGKAAGAYRLKGEGHDGYISVRRLGLFRRHR